MATSQIWAKWKKKKIVSLYEVIERAAATIPLHSKMERFEHTHMEFGKWIRRGSPRLGVHSVDFRRFSCRVAREARAGTARAQLKIVVG